MLIYEAGSVRIHSSLHATRVRAGPSDGVPAHPWGSFGPRGEPESDHGIRVEGLLGTATSSREAVRCGPQAEDSSLVTSRMAMGSQPWAVIAVGRTCRTRSSEACGE